MAVPPFEEAGDSLSPSSDSLSAEDGACTRIWRTAKSYVVTDPQDVIDAQTYFVGGTSTGVNPGGRLARKLPAPDPQHINWWCRRINSVRGIADRNKVEDGYGIDLSMKDKLLALDILPPVPTPLPGYCLYPMYELNVTSGPRSYPLVRDDKIACYASSGPTGAALRFYWPDRQTVSGYAYAEEWKRFTAGPKYQPSNDYVTAQQGSFVFRCANGDVPNRFAFSGMPRILLRTDVLTVEWFMVPVRYITSPRSFIRRFRGLVNQYPWYGPAGREKYGAGSLLYLAYEYGDFCPSLNGYEVIFPGEGGNPDVLGSPRLCNVRMTFLHTDRKATNPVVPAWPGDVVDGHNALPWFGAPGNFYYATSTGVGLGVANPVNWYPMFGSAPIPQLLFTDPDAPQPADFPPPGGGGI